MYDHVYLCFLHFPCFVSCFDLSFICYFHAVHTWFGCPGSPLSTPARACIAGPWVSSSSR
uniref:Uncharacterized protein n=1 Tax=Rhizophora mucronata TaxID=61149 RepID=A0A2P2M433_RHIMU